MKMALSRTILGAVAAGPVNPVSTGPFLSSLVSCLVALLARHTCRASLAVFVHANYEPYCFKSDG